MTTAWILTSFSVFLGPPTPPDLPARPFRLENVRLLEGPFQRAMELDAAYLLRLEPDRLLAGFRSEAGLQPKAAKYGGWEAAGVAGHFLGHYLSACSLMYASTGDTRFRERVAYIVDELEACQNANGNGYVAAIPEGKRVFAEIAAGDVRAESFNLNGLWVPWYTLHKLFAGLLEAHRHCDSVKALAVAGKLADWVEVTTANLTQESWQTMLACEHGGMNEALAELYDRTGNERYLNLSRRFHHQAVLDPLAAGKDILPGLHGNTQIPKIIGVARRYELAGDPRDRAIAEFFWDRVVHHHSYVTGGHSDGEHFGPPDRLNDRLSANTTETCNTYNMLKLTRHLFGWSPSAAIADFYERALYNHILASQNPDDGMMCYYLPLRSGEFKRYSTPFDSFWCCTGTGIENHAKYGDSIYFHGEDELYVNLFIPSELAWREKGLILRQETHFPEEETVRFAFFCERPIELTVYLRCPGWCAAPPQVKVNGEVSLVSARPGGYVSVRRAWQTGDNLELRLPMKLRLESMPDNPKRAAVLYGPIVLAGDLGPQDAPPPETDTDLLRNPALVIGDRLLQEWLLPVAGQPLTFRTASTGRPADFILIPFYRMHQRIYAVYWDLLTEEEWAQREADQRAELERRRELEARTVDMVRIGEEASEREHNLQGENTDAGEYGGRRWRHAWDGGWFSYELKVSPDEPVDLVCTFWGSDVGARTFDILVEGEKLATLTLNNNQPGRFFDQIYPLPEEMTRGKQKVTVRLQGHPGNLAGGIFGCRMVRRGGP